MMGHSWVIDALGRDQLEAAVTAANRARVAAALSAPELGPGKDDERVFVARVLDMAVQQHLKRDDDKALRDAAAQAFQVARTLDVPAEPLAAAHWLVRLGCLAVLGDRSADFHRMTRDAVLPNLSAPADDWGTHVWSCTLDIWLRLLRKDGWADLDHVQQRVAELRRAQAGAEPSFLEAAAERGDVQPAWRLIAEYHLATAAELLGTWMGQGSVDGSFDIREQLETQFDRAINASDRGNLIEHRLLAPLLARTARAMVAGSIWTVTRAVNSRVTRFVESLTSRERSRPIFEMLPPQRRVLREAGLLGASDRSVVVSLPTSSGKTFIAQFRMLQALNQFDDQRGWVAYLAPTRALVNQLTVRLRRDFTPLGVTVEKVSPALEVDGLEATMLVDGDADRQFRVLVTTPEKLDLMLRGGWEQRIGRPLTLVVVDEAHGLGTDVRGLRLELLLATINRQCRDAQFLLLTPFISNGGDIARWLDKDSNRSIDLGVSWTPNDRIVGIVEVDRGEARGDYSLALTTCHTSNETLVVEGRVGIGGNRPLAQSWSAVKNSPPLIAAAAAQVLHERGTMIVLASAPASAWSIANALKLERNLIDNTSPDVAHIRRFLADEMGDDFPLIELLDYGIGVHHTGLSEDARALIEWLTEHGHLRVLVATTTIAQDVNFPVSGVVFANHQQPSSRADGPGWQDMSPADFWNIAGRAGRVDQGDVGIVALAAKDPDDAAVLTAFVRRSVGELNSTLIAMVQRVMATGELLELEKISRQPGWSAFVQYLAHTYRQIGNHDQFAAQVEHVLRGTLGFRELRQTHRDWADALVRSVYRYAERLKGAPLALVDATGFSLESVWGTMGRLGQKNLSADAWSAELFSTRRGDLAAMMGVLLEVPELREQLTAVTGNESNGGDRLARIVCDWVQGRPLTELADTYFRRQGADEADRVEAMTRCCRNIFSRLTQTASWGLAALQAITIGDRFDALPEDEQRRLRNLPARVYYGVNSDEAVALRLLGVPRTAASPLARTLGVLPDEPLHVVRARLRSADASVWVAALGDHGASHHRVWSIVEGTDG